MKRAANSFSAKRRKPAAVPKRTRPAAVSSAWATNRNAAAARPSVKNQSERRGLDWFQVVILMVLVAGFGLAGSVLVRSIRDRRQEAARNLALKKAIEQQQDENRRLEAEIKNIKTNPKVVENLVREQLGLSRPEEMVIDPPK